MRKDLDILVVDDEPAFLKLTSKMLNKMGFKAETCERGIQAISMIARDPQKFDLIMLDIIMPELNGTQTYLKIREINPSLPVVFVSGYSLEENLSDLAKTGAKGYLKKPFHQSDLNNLLEKLF